MSDKGNEILDDGLFSVKRSLETPYWRIILEVNVFGVFLLLISVIVLTFFLTLVYLIFPFEINNFLGSFVRVYMAVFQVVGVMYCLNNLYTKGKFYPNLYLGIISVSIGYFFIFLVNLIFQGFDFIDRLSFSYFEKIVGLIFFYNIFLKMLLVYLLSIYYKNRKITKDHVYRKRK